MEGLASVLQPPEPPSISSSWYRYSLIVDGLQKRGGIKTLWGCLREILDAWNSLVPERPHRVGITLIETGREVE